MAASVKRAAAVLAGVVLGMVIAAGASPWRELRRKAAPVARPVPILRERAPDVRA